MRNARLTTHELELTLKVIDKATARAKKDRTLLLNIRRVIASLMYGKTKAITRLG